MVLNILLLQWDFILLEVTFYFAFQKKASRVPWQQLKTLHLFIVVAAVVDEGNEVTSFVKNCTTLDYYPNRIHYHLLSPLASVVNWMVKAFE